jgi:TolB protein
MPRLTLAFAFALLAVLAIPLSARAEGLELSIKDGNSAAIPIAIVPFAWEAAAMPDETRVDQIVRADLNRTGQFRTPQSLPANPVRGAEVNYAQWEQNNQDYVLIGRVQASETGYRVEFELHDIVNNKVRFVQALSVRPGDFRTVAHQIADIVYEEILKVRGAFHTRIAYVTAKRLPNSGFEYSVVVADWDGFHPIRVVTHTEPFLSPTWSPDGKSLAYVSFERKSGPAIFIHNLATQSRSVLTSFKGINGAPVFSPDGRRLALTLSRSGNPEIYTLDLATNSLTQLTKHFSIDTEAAWMPGGNSLLFTSDRAGKPQIYSLSASGGTPERVTSVGEYNSRVNVSYDGRLLAMVHGNRNVYRIAVLDRQRGGAGTVRLISPGPMDESPTFAPNASMILYAAREGNRGVLYAAPADGSVRYRLANPDGDIREPSWGPFSQR